MAGKPTKIKRKKSVVLQPKQLEVVEDPPESGEAPPPARRKVVIQKASEPGTRVVKRSGTPSVVESKSAEEPRSEEPEAEDELPADVSSLPVGKPVDLNSRSVNDPVMQRPLDVDAAPPAPRKPPREVLGEPTFKFFCYRCGQKLMVPVSWANKSYPCGRCGHDIVIPPPLIGNVW
jgi:hypothetical protein